MWAPILKVVTINIFSDLSLWDKRRGPLVRELADLKPDLIALQEVSLAARNAQWLAEQVGLEHVYLSPKAGEAGKREGIAILSQLPFQDQATLDLKTQNRVAQCVRVEKDGRPVVLVNGHFFWQPGDSPERQLQIERLLDWLDEIAGNLPVVVCGDFNATPEMPSIKIMQQHFSSAYAAKHGKEPDYTTPTPLPRSKLKLILTLYKFIKYLRLRDIELDWRGTLDYIFVNEFIQVIDCQIVLDKPAPDDPSLYPSDHFGLMAVLEFKNE